MIINHFIIVPGGRIITVLYIKSFYGTCKLTKAHVSVVFLKPLYSLFSQIYNNSGERKRINEQFESYSLLAGCEGRDNEELWLQ